MKILTDDAPEEAKKDMEAFFRKTIEKSKEFSKESDHAYLHNNFQAGVTAAFNYDPASVNLIALTTGSGKSWLEAFTISLNPQVHHLVIVRDTILKN